jgi:dolichol-phosphate mannosyltransferase
MSAVHDPSPAVSVVVPVFNERDNIPPLIAEIVAALRGEACLRDRLRRRPLARRFLGRAAGADARGARTARAAPRQQSGQSTAIRTGVKAARAPWIATLDGDGQNDPADIPKLLTERDAGRPS